MGKPLFSVVVIAKNEEKTLPRLLKSLTAFMAAGGEVVVCDTGSTDNTLDIAQQAGCVVSGPNVFATEVTEGLAWKVQAGCVDKDKPPIVKVGERLFHYSAARNYAAGLASNDFVAMPDCDEEYTAFDFEKISQLLREEDYSQFEYNFVFSHDADDKPLVKFTHCKFYNRRQLEWTGAIHEVLTPKAGIKPCERKFLDEGTILLEHWQNRETDRSHYLKGLALDCERDPSNDRNLHYYARELMWAGYHHTAIDKFCCHIAMNKWPAERAQSFIYRGDCMRAVGAPFLEDYFRAILVDSGRREAFMRLASHFYRERNAQQTLTWATAALAIPLNCYYGNNLDEYRHLPHEMAYWAAWELGNKIQSEQHWQSAFSFQPHNTQYLHDARFYQELPKVSIIIPHILGTREAELKRLLAAIKANANYPNYEVVIEPDSLNERAGVALVLKRGVKQAKGKLIMFLGDDCVPQENFLIEAVLAHQRYFGRDAGLTALNDFLWGGKLATHWLADKDLPEVLEIPDFFCTEYHHVGCDNELTGRAKKAGRYDYCEAAKVKHDTPQDEVQKLAWDPERVKEDRARLLARSAKFRFPIIH